MPVQGSGLLSHEGTALSSRAGQTEKVYALSAGLGRLRVQAGRGCHSKLQNLA